nr:hypothetical protein [Tanacetum cinerariifolium]
MMSQRHEQAAQKEQELLEQEQAVEEKQELLAEEQAANPSEPSPVSYFYNADYDNISTLDDKSLSNEDVSMENFKIYSNPLFDDEEIISTKIDPYYFNAESNLLKSLLNRDTLIDSSPKFDYLLKEFSGKLAHIDPIPPRIEEADFDLEEEIQNELSNFDHHDDPSFPRPPLEPPDVEVLFNFEPDTGVLTTKVVKGISEHYVLMPNILPTLPTLDSLRFVFNTLLPFSSENEDKVFKHGILSYLLVSHRDKNTSDFSENLMMIAPDFEDSRARGFVHRLHELQSLAFRLGLGQ